MTKSGARSLLVGWLLLLAACASEPILESHSASVPAGIDFTGFWRLRDNPGSRPFPEAARDEPLIESRQTSTRRSQTSRKGSSAHVFIEYGEQLKISQTPHGLFVSYDRAVVEEYTFGENRLVTIGPIEAKRVSGWDGQIFVVETLDRNRTVLSERWRLDAADVLRRDIRLAKGDNEKFVLTQYFDRT